jgi:hypothetical protein
VAQREARGGGGVKLAGGEGGGGQLPIYYRESVSIMTWGPF